MGARALRDRVRYLLGFFVFGLLVSGLTAIPLRWEVDLLRATVGPGTFMEGVWPGAAHWVSLVQQGVTATHQQYPFVFYGTDWLAFGHVAIAIAFWGPLRDPVRNLWVIEFGMIACGLVIPWAMVFGPLRGIPFAWRLIDCSFGVFGIVPLWLAHRWTRRIAALERAPAEAGAVGMRPQALA